MDDKTFSNRFDYSLLFMIFLLFCISCLALYTAQVQHLVNGNYLLQQIIWYVIALPILALGIFVDLDIYKRLSLYIYLFCLVLILGILIAPNSIAPELNGAKGWYRIGPFSIQPTEFMKIGFIFMLSQLISKHSENPKYDRDRFRDECILIGKMLLALLPLGYLTKELPDMGSLLVYAFIFFSVLIVSTVRFRTILLFMSPVVILLGACVYAYLAHPHFFFNTILGALPSYQAERFYGWLDSSHYTNSEGYQLQQALVTIGSGQIYGNAVGSSLVPYAYSDFVFAIIGGAYGFLGSAVLIIIFFIIMYRIVIISMAYQDYYGQLVCAGIIGMIGFQLFQNIGMTVGLLPITGLSLPFISYGGSSLVINVFAIGLVLNIKLNTRKFMFS
ncbi:FtsW/RodA/SpoVE family cell cycle protein [Pullulanibacillus sp. KACC 23026]|uniref:FtsW/RodA/SpoVE family cell cycle protein n=1 Tax=Pullulanibacillus sp. KACC 23026 TaxID=3028315 RepID=UPI0023B11524|nr:FtsW/RodA/SpoVE family cell cycle protein [Pullulanibacillus sp. KACC 23026]WEG10922.1 FtsW/RodA/SpoVE family cell cycle protein [Pullulanibacillus sp. KACC 23026]